MNKKIRIINNKSQNLNSLSVYDFGKIRIVNFRSFLIIAIFLLFAVFCALIAVNLKILGIIFLCCLVFIAAFFCFFLRKCKLKFITFLICILTCPLVYSSFLITESCWIKKDDFQESKSVIGILESDVEIDGTRKIYLKDLSINGDSAKGKMLLYVREQGKLESGTLITVVCYVKPNYLINGYSVNGWAFRDNIRYTATVTASDLKIIGLKNPGLFVKIREFIYNKLTLGLGQKYGALAYGMITGDKAFLNTETKNYFSIAGLSHILAVSGLHLGVLTAFLTFILRVLKTPRQITAISVFVFLVIYAFIAGFSPSVLRAAIMSSVGLLVYLFGTQKDMLSSLCFAFCLIVLFAPFYLFEAGFILSFCCVFGIVLFNNPIKKQLLKIKFPKFLSSTAALSISVQIGLIPAAIFLFNNIQPYSVFVNIIAVPFVMILFIAIFVCLIFSTVIPSYIILFKLPKVGLTALDYLAEWVSLLPYAKVIVYSMPIIFAAYLLYFFSSPFFMVKRRWIIQVLSLFLCVILITAQNPPMTNSHTIAPIDNTFSALTYITNNENSYLCGDIWSGNITIEKLKTLKVRSLDGIFLEKIDINIARQIQIIFGFYNNFILYFPIDTIKEADRVEISKLLINIKTIPFSQNAEKNLEFINLTSDFAAVYYNQEFCGYQFIPNESTQMFLPRNNFKYNKYEFINRYNIIRTFKMLSMDEDKKLFLIGEKAEGKNVYSFAEKEYFYDYLTFNFYYKK